MAADGTTGAPGQTRIRLGAALRVGSDRTVAALYAITLLLVGFGLIMVLSSSSVTSYADGEGSFGGFWRQATFALLGLPLMLIAAAMPISFWKRWAWWFLGLGLGLQLLVFTPLGLDLYGNRNWIQIGNTTAQPSEALKLALVVWIGAVMLKKEPLFSQMRHEVVPIIPGAILALALVLLGKDLGTTIIMAALVFGAMYFGGMSWKTLGVSALGGLIAVALFVVTSENRMQRLFSFSGTSSEDYSGLDWQPLHGLWALAGGGLFGVGLGGSKAKWSWLPAADNDYIFAIIGEELGLVGALLVIVLFVVLAYLMLRVISRARDRFGKAVVGGILVWIVGQAFVNIGVVIRVLPVLGVPLPLISSGGTALISCLVAIGVVISIARDAAQHETEITASAGGRTGSNTRRGR